MRLPGFDYASESAYFVTLVTKDRQPLFGEIVDEGMVLSDFGRIVAEEWERSATIRKEIELGEYVVMPNHFHGIVHICNDNDGRIDQNSSPSDVGAYGQIGRGNRQADTNSGRGDRPVAPTDRYLPLVATIDRNSPPVATTDGFSMLVAPTIPHGPSPKSLGSLITGFKSSVTTRVNIIRKTPGISVWQRNFYDHIIGTDREYEQIEDYILDNPRKWAWDEENRPIK
jgi:REP element-mobilizing transposase RayT